MCLHGGAFTDLYSPLSRVIFPLKCCFHKRNTKYAPPGKGAGDSFTLAADNVELMDEEARQIRRVTPEACGKDFYEADPRLQSFAETFAQPPQAARKALNNMSGSFRSRLNASSNDCPRFNRDRIRPIAVRRTVPPPPSNICPPHSAAYEKPLLNPSIVNRHVSKQTRHPKNAKYNQIQSPPDARFRWQMTPKHKPSHSQNQQAAKVKTRED